MFRFFARVALSLAQLHFKAHTLHGNISLGSLMIKPLENNSDIDPITTDFRSALVNDSGEDIPDDQLRYNFDYRPPEMTGKTKEGSILDQKAWHRNWSRYKYSKDFLEDVYALGKTTKKAFEFQEGYVSTSLCEYKAPEEISEIMIKATGDEPADIASANTRPTMIKVFEMSIEKTEECNKGVDNSLHFKFVTKARRSLRYIPKRIVII